MWNFNNYYKPDLSSQMTRSDTGSRNLKKYRFSYLWQGICTWQCDCDNEEVTKQLGRGIQLGSRMRKRRHLNIAFKDVPDGAVIFSLHASFRMGIGQCRCYPRRAKWIHVS